MELSWTFFGFSNGVSSSSNSSIPDSSTEIPTPLPKTIPFSDESSLEEKTISYWIDTTTVEATTVDNEDGTYGITYSSNDASWVDLQVLYKNSDLEKNSPIFFFMFYN